MNNIQLMTLKLFIIASAAALTLGVVNSFTAPKIAQLEREAKIEALKQLTDRGFADPDSEVVLDDNESIASYFEITDGGEIIGYILSLNAKGYGGKMNVMASYRDDGTIINSVLMANSETPGFGKKAEKSDYMVIFHDKGSSENPIPQYVSQVENSDVVSSATITFMGISQALVTGSEFVKGGVR